MTTYSYCVACEDGAPREVGFLCLGCHEALAGLREVWREEGEASRRRNLRRPEDTEERIELYALRAARGEPLFDGLYSTGLRSNSD